MPNVRRQLSRTRCASRMRFGMSGPSTPALGLLMAVAVNSRRLIVRDAAIRDRAVAMVSGLPVNAERPLEVLVRAYKRNRSLAQNACLWGWLTAIANSYADSHGERIAPEAWKEYLCGLFLGSEVKEVLGKAITVTHSTSALDVTTFRDFLNDIEHWAVEHLQLFLPHGYDYEEAMGR